MPKSITSRESQLQKIFARVHFCGLAIFCVLRELIFAFTTRWFSCWELIFAIFRKYPVPSLDKIFVFVKYVQKEIHIFKQYYGMRTLCLTSISLYTVLFLNERGKLQLNEQTRFLSTVFLCNEFKE